MYNDNVLSIRFNLIGPCLLTTKALKDIVFRFIIEYYSSSRDFYRPLGNNNNNNNNNNRSIFIYMRIFVR
jgi:hypothetical protein